MIDMNDFGSSAGSDIDIAHARTFFFFFEVWSVEQASLYYF